MKYRSFGIDSGGGRSGISILRLGSMVLFLSELNIERRTFARSFHDYLSLRLMQAKTVVRDDAGL